MVVEDFHTIDVTQHEKQSTPPLWENARLQSGYSYEIDKKE